VLLAAQAANYSPLPAERNRVGWRDQNCHRAATVLGHDVALGGPVTRGTPKDSLHPGRCQPDNWTDVDLPLEKSAFAPFGRAGRGESPPSFGQAGHSPEQGDVLPGKEVVFTLTFARER